jgi:hypothetical protein
MNGYKVLVIRRISHILVPCFCNLIGGGTVPVHVWQCQYRYYIQSIRATGIQKYMLMFQYLKVLSNLCFQQCTE